MGRGPGQQGGITGVESGSVECGSKGTLATRRSPGLCTCLQCTLPDLEEVPDVFQAALNINCQICWWACSIPVWHIPYPSGLVLQLPD